MAYVAIKGGEKAIEEAQLLSEFLRTEQSSASSPLCAQDIEHQLRQLNSRVLSEGGLYNPELAALALKQSMGDPLEASFALRAYRSTKPRRQETEAHNSLAMRLIRRISSAFKDIPGGQMLGATPDYSLRLLRFELLDETKETFQKFSRQWLTDLPLEELPDSFPKVVDSLRDQGLIHIPEQVDREPYDLTRQPIAFPIPRSAVLQSMSRGETGALLLLAYSNMRGFGDVHPTVAELRVGYLPVYLPHPVTGEPLEAGEILMTECEIVAMFEHDQQETGQPKFTIGYGACFGHNEIKAICMAILDRAMQKGRNSGPSHPSEDPEFIVLHIDGIESMGFCTHYKMPHYVTFQADMDRLRTAQSKRQETENRSQQTKNQNI